MTPYGDVNLCYIGSGNGLLPDGNKPLPEPMLTYHQWGQVAFFQGQFHMNCWKIEFMKWVWKLLFWNYSHFSQVPISWLKLKKTICLYGYLIILYLGRLTGRWTEREIEPKQMSTTFQITPHIFNMMGDLKQREPLANIWNLNSSPPIVTYMRQWIRSALLQIMACHLFGAKPLSEPMLGYCQLDP